MVYIRPHKPHHSVMSSNYQKHIFLFNILFFYLQDNSVEAKREVAIRGLMVYLREKEEELFKEEVNQTPPYFEFTETECVYYRAAHEQSRAATSPYCTHSGAIAPSMDINVNFLVDNCGAVSV